MAKKSNNSGRTGNILMAVLAIIIVLAMILSMFRF